MQNAQDVPGQLQSAAGESREPEGTFPGVGLGRASVRGLLQHVTFLLRVYPGCSRAPLVCGICQKGETGTQ